MDKSKFKKAELFMEHIQRSMNDNKGQAGLGVLTSILVSLFVISMIVLVFVLTSVQLGTSTTLDNESLAVLNSSRVAIGGVTVWYGIIITMAVLTVLILLMAIFVNAIRQTGLLGGGA